MTRTALTIERITEECEKLLTEVGLCNYAEVGRRLNVSRQTIQQRLTSAVNTGNLKPELFERYRPKTGQLKQRFNTSLSPENAEFVKALAAQLEVPPACILHAAIDQYRTKLKNWAAAPHLPVHPRITTTTEI